MQNKPNLLNAQINVASVKTMDYENKPRLRTPAKQTQSNPISPPSPPTRFWEKVEPTRPYVQVAVLMGRLILLGLFHRPISVDH